jgi:hypothetical protein
MQFMGSKLFNVDLAGVAIHKSSGRWLCGGIIERNSAFAFVRRFISSPGRKYVSNVRLERQRAHEGRTVSARTVSAGCAR